MRTIRSTKVCVVGGAGFLSSHLVDHLIEDRDCDVLVVDNLCAGRREFVNKAADFEYHDITGSESRLLHLLRAYGARYVFNYAAWPYIPTSFARPLHVCDVNFMGAMKVINAAQEAGCDGILQVSSAEIYGNGHTEGKPGEVLKNYPGRLDESTAIEPHSSYGVAKAAVDSWVQCRWREAGTPCIALRQFNCVGERETHPYIVPEIIGQLAKQLLRCNACGGVGERGHDNRRQCETCSGLGYFQSLGKVRLGNNSFRDFLYAGDQARIAVELLERGQFGGVYNLGSETGIKMYDLAKLIGKVMGFADVVVEKDESRVRPWEIWHLQSDNTKIKNAVVKMCGKHTFDHPAMSPTPLEVALKLTVEWYNKNGRKWVWE